MRFTSTCWICAASSGASGNWRASFSFTVKPAIVQFRPQQRQGFLHDLIQRGGLQLRRRRADGLQKLRDDVIQPVDFAFGDFKILFEPVRDFAGILGHWNRVAARAAAGRRDARRVGFEFLDLPLHELQMDMQRVQRIADFVRHAGRQQGQRLDAFALDGFEGFLPRLGGIVKNQRQTGCDRVPSPSSGAA